MPHHRTEKASEPHQRLRAAPGNANRAEAQSVTTYGIDHPASTGVIYVMDRAFNEGFTYADHTWANFGQGAPEVGHIPGCVDKPKHIDVPLESLEYAPTGGIKALREAVANLYNDLYRQGKSSQYTYKNVCIVPGGRAGLTRVAAAIGHIQVGYFLPEYTAYEQMLGIFRRFVPIPTSLDEDTYHFTPAQVRAEIAGRGLGMIVVSNPHNPTGQIIEGEELKEVIDIVKQRHASLCIDEFYSSYVYTHSEEDAGRSVSAAEFVEDVDQDPVIIIDGMTKNFRLPGWRVCWIVAPQDVISSMESAGSFLEGGANHPLQLACLPLLEPQHVRAENKALQIHFRAKRDFVLQRLAELGLPVKVIPQATFYIWLDLRPLPAPLNSGLHFFEECLKEKVILVPGIFFDINPSHRRELFESPCHHYVRLSFGPPQEELAKGLNGIERVLRKHNFTA